MTTLSALQLQAIRSEVLHMAAAERPGAYRTALEHIALDCEWAAEGCRNSMESVRSFIEGDYGRV